MIFKKFWKLKPKTDEFGMTKAELANYNKKREEEELKQTKAVRMVKNISSANKPDRKDMRIIKTVRDIDAINEAAKSGFSLLLVKVVPSNEIGTKLFVFQNKQTGEIIEVKDYRAIPSEEEFNCVLSFGFYYPYKYSLPYAAYLLPKDLMKDEWVFIEDLIEDIIGGTWNQGDVFRLENIEAKWNGEFFETSYSPEKNSVSYVG